MTMSLFSVLTLAPAVPRDREPMRGGETRQGGQSCGVTGRVLGRETVSGTVEGGLA